MDNHKLSKYINEPFISFKSLKEAEKKKFVIKLKTIKEKNN